MIFSAAPDHDEVEHAHAAWQMSQGLLPYNDFFQHHSPMLYIILSPLFKIPAIANHPLESFRLISTGVSLSVLVLLCFTAKTVWKDKKAAWIVILFFAGNFLTLQFYVLRPDLFANLCNLSAFSLILGRRKTADFGLAGWLIGFSLSLSPKYGPFLLWMPVLMAVEHKNLSFRFRALLAHAAGIGIGLLPLFAWLWAHDLAAPFYRWVLAFNAGRLADGAAAFGGKFQLLPAGFGGIVESMASFMGRGRCLTGKRVTRIFHKHGLVRSVELNHAENPPADRVVSTLPLPHFLELLEPACPHEISALADGLNYRKLILVMLFLNVDSVTRSGTVYFPGPEFPFNRVSEPKNRSPFMAPPGKTSLTAEITCGRDESPDEAGKERWVQTVVQKLSQIGWIREADVLDSRVVVMDYAYPVLDVDHGEKLARIMEYLRSFKNLDLIGRNSLFKYTHFHDIMRSAREWANERAA